MAASRVRWDSNRQEVARKRHDNTRATNRGTEKRERIVRAGAKVFALRGYAGTTLNEIADLAGTQAASIYYYFPSREDLLTEILSRGVRENVENARHLIEQLPEGQSSADRLRAALNAHITYMVQSDFSRAGIRSVGQLPPEIHAQILPHWDDYGHFFDELFSDAARDGYLAADVDLHALRLLVIGAGNWATHWFDRKGPISAEYLGELMNRMVFSGCAGPAYAESAAPRGQGQPKKRPGSVAGEARKTRSKKPAIG